MFTSIHQSFFTSHQKTMSQPPQIMLLFIIIIIDSCAYSINDKMLTAIIIL